VVWCGVVWGTACLLDTLIIVVSTPGAADPRSVAAHEFARAALRD
jgi:hypothetical protein